MSEASIDKVVAFNSICPYLDPHQRDELAATLGLSAQDLEHRLQGLRNEDELALVLHFLRCCKHLLKFDEGLSQLTQSASPDLLVQLLDGETMFVEVKSSTKDLKKISKGNLKRRIEVASDLGHPLFFAVKQRGMWGLFPAEHVAKTGKLKLVEDFKSSVFGAKFGNLLYTLPAGVEFRRVYQHGASGPLKHREHGTLVGFSVRFRGKTVLRARDSEPDMFAALLLGAVMSQAMPRIRRRGEATVCAHRLAFNLVVADYHLYLDLVRRTIRPDGQGPYDRTTYLKTVQSREEPVNVAVVRELFRRLEAGGLPCIRLQQ